MRMRTGAILPRCEVLRFPPYLNRRWAGVGVMAASEGAPPVPVVPPLSVSIRLLGVMLPQHAHPVDVLCAAYDTIDGAGTGSRKETVSRFVCLRTRLHCRSMSCPTAQHPCPSTCPHYYCTPSHLYTALGALLGQCGSVQSQGGARSRTSLLVRVVTVDTVQLLPSPRVQHPLPCQRVCVPDFCSVYIACVLVCVGQTRWRWWTSPSQRACLRRPCTSGWRPYDGTSADSCPPHSQQPTVQPACKCGVPWVGVFAGCSA